MARTTSTAGGASSLTPEMAHAIERRLIQQEFQRQPARKQTETIERILAILVDEYRRMPNVHSALWHRMEVWGFTEHLIRHHVERGTNQ